MWTVANDDCLEVMRSMPDNSVDSIVTDPPYELGFMGKGWDASGIAYNVKVWAEALRVLRPGGYLLAFGGTRTYHRMACAIEDAGFEIRDSLHWIYGSGFPKSLDISKAIDKSAGAEREVIGRSKYADKGRTLTHKVYSQATASDQEVITTPATDAAKEWEGWGTALKPAHEPIVLARKPLAVKTVAANVLEHGTGGLNIDACRIGYETADKEARKARTGNHAGEAYGHAGTVRYSGGEVAPVNDAGRWPANVIFDEEAGKELDAQSGLSKGSSGTHCNNRDDYGKCLGHKNAGRSTSGETFHGPENTGESDFGGASRFFYCPKASKKERPTVDGVSHPTVKPVALMRWLVRLVTPADGVVLDPFAGTGATAEACELEGFNSVMIEKEPDHIKLIEARMAKYGEEEAA